MPSRPATAAGAGGPPSTPSPGKAEQPDPRPKEAPHDDRATAGNRPARRRRRVLVQPRGAPQRLSRDRRPRGPRDPLADITTPNPQKDVGGGEHRHHRT